MILYSKNPNLKLKTVTTVQGDTEYRRNCKFIRNKYYVKDRDVFEINNKWYTIEGGCIVYNYSSKKWIHKSEAGKLTKGIVDFKNNKAVIGFFEFDPNRDGRMQDSGLNIMDVDSHLQNDNIVENVATGLFYEKANLSSSNILKISKIRNEKNHSNRGYSIEDNVDDFKNKVKSHNNYSPKISSNCVKYSKHLGDITFGAEVEIFQGNYPSYLQNRHGIVICRDGSIDGGPELVTIPITGAKGVTTLAEIGNNLVKRGDININCSYHIHIGNIPKTKLFIVACYILCRKIQNEIFTMFPGFKSDYKGIKRKDYNRKLEDLGIISLKDHSKESYDSYLDYCYINIFNFLVENKIKYDKFNKTTREHPESRKWERRNRYMWVNFMNMFFTHRYTVEFRLHEATTNPYKMINWLYICNAILKYADHFSNQIITNDDPITVKQVLNIYKVLNPKSVSASNLTNYLTEYFEQRKLDFQKDVKNGDRISQWSMDEDKKYKFETAKVKSLF